MIGALLEALVTAVAKVVIAQLGSKPKPGPRVPPLPPKHQR